MKRKTTNIILFVQKIIVYSTELAYTYSVYNGSIYIVPLNYVYVSYSYRIMIYIFLESCRFVLFA